MHYAVQKKKNVTIWNNSLTIFASGSFALK